MPTGAAPHEAAPAAAAEGAAPASAAEEAADEAAPASATQEAAPAAAPLSKRSRWSTNGEGSADGGGKRQSRWANKAAVAPAAPQPLTSTALALATPGEMLGAALAMGIPIPVFSAMPDDRRRALIAAKYQIDQIDRKLALDDCGVSDVPHGARSPSPEPVFDDMGSRLNTREQRERTKLLRQREELMKQMRPPDPPKPVGKRCALASERARMSGATTPPRRVAHPLLPLPRCTPPLAPRGSNRRSRAATAACAACAVRA